MRWLLPALVVVALSATPARASSSCTNLTVTDHVRQALFNAHDRPRDGVITPGSIYYGRCGSKRYAIASFSKALADQPEKFSKRAGHAWKDKGDGFENGCGPAAYPIPAKLVHIWGFCN